MIPSELTNRAQAATSPRMDEARQGKRRSTRRLLGTLGVLAVSTLALSACISVQAPDKPIVIELNINIKQEVVYRLAADAGNTIEDNSAIF